MIKSRRLLYCATHPKVGNAVSLFAFIAFSIFAIRVTQGICQEPQSEPRPDSPISSYADSLFEADVAKKSSQIFEKYDSGMVAEAAAAQKLLVDELIKHWGESDWRTVNQISFLSEMKAVSKLPKAAISEYLLARQLFGNGVQYVSLENDIQAHDCLTDALGVLVHHLGEDSVTVAAVLELLGVVEMRMERFDDAQETLKRALNSRKIISGENHPDFSNVLNLLGTVYLEAKQFAKAEKVLREALAYERKLFGNQSLRYAEALNRLSSAMIGTGKLAEAEVLTVQAKSIIEKAAGPQSRPIAASFINLAKIHIAMNEHDAARTSLQQSLGVFVKTTPHDTLVFAAILERYARMMKQIKNGDDVSEIESRAASIRAQKQMQASQ